MLGAQALSQIITSGLVITIDKVGYEIDATAKKQLDKALEDYVRKGIWPEKTIHLVQVSTGNTVGFTPETLFLALTTQDELNELRGISTSELRKISKNDIETVKAKAKSRLLRIIWIIRFLLLGFLLATAMSVYIQVDAERLNIENPSFSMGLESLQELTVLDLVFVGFLTLSLGIFLILKTLWARYHYLGHQRQLLQ